MIDIIDNLPNGTPCYSDAMDDGTLRVVMGCALLLLLLLLLCGVLKRIIFAFKPADTTNRLSWMRDLVVVEPISSNSKWEVSSYGGYIHCGSTWLICS